MVGDGATRMQLDRFLFGPFTQYAFCRVSRQGKDENYLSNDESQSGPFVLMKNLLRRGRRMGTKQMIIIIPHKVISIAYIVQHAKIKMY